MNRATRMLELLRDGQRHSRRDLFERCGFFLTNNAASELRAEGHDIEQTREMVRGDVVYFYRLRGTLEASPPEPDQSADPPSLTEDGKQHDHTHGGRSGSEGEGEQEPLFTYPRSPAWQ